MIRVDNLTLQPYPLSFTINPGEIKGIFGRDLKVTKEILLKIAGIHQNNKTCFMDNHDVYDNPHYFKQRIYLDCRLDYIQTLRIETIVNTIWDRYQKRVDGELLQKYIKFFGIRGECEITHRYTFSDNAQTLLNISLVMAMNQHLLLFRPTAVIKRSKDIEFINQELKKRKQITLLGLNCLGDFKGTLNQIILLGDKTSHLINPTTDKFSVVDAHNMFEGSYLFKSTDDKRMIIPALSKEHNKICDRHKIKHITIDVYDIENYW